MRKLTDALYYEQISALGNLDCSGIKAKCYLVGLGKRLFAVLGVF